MDEQSIFLAAIGKDTAQQRAAFLDHECAGDEELRNDLEGLIQAHEKLGHFLEGQPIGIEKTVNHYFLERPGDTIGPYRLVEQIGEGGMGVVYLAEQEEPVKRQVALKIIKPGLDTRNVIARFEAERQALAMMDHPHIAKVLDAGQTESGKPYFVMELVKGVPITEYCDEHHASLRERMAVILPVCQAVQHAHQKGIIHRDLKPSNILVASCDGEPMPKVIDFGVAKAVDQQLTDKTMFTQFGQVVGTIEYMSPEQAQLNHVDVDTRSDIYSLGVLLYELLTGETPFGKQRLGSAAIHELFRVIREEEPEKPSTKIHTVEKLSTIAANRQTEPQRLSYEVRGELDWIVMKALEKDRRRRYATANGLARDLERYLADEPVQACPPSAAYRMRKFIRRRRGLLTTAALLFGMLLIGSGVSAWQAIRATRAEGLAKLRLLEANDARREAEQMLRQVQTSRAYALASGAALLAARSEFDAAKQQFHRAVMADPENPLAANNFAWFLATCPAVELRDAERAVKLAEQATELRPGSSVFWNTLGAAYYRAGRWQDAIEMLNRSAALANVEIDAFNGFFLAMAHWRLDAREEAHEQYRKAAEWMKSNRPKDAELLNFCSEAEELLGIDVGDDA